jgi:hypothetical protein
MPGGSGASRPAGSPGNPGEFLHWLRVRWPTPVAALIQARLPVNTPHRLPHQVANLTRTLARGSAEYRSSISLSLRRPAQTR